MVMLEGDERLPRYQRLADALRLEVIQKIRKPGDRLPSENGIAEEFGVAPGTARQALSLLVKEGIIERHHGRGTFVRQPDFTQSLFRFFRFQSKSGARRIPESKILKREICVAPEEIAKALEIEKDGRAIMMSRLRILDDTPVLTEEIWLSFSKFEKFLDMNEADIGPLLYPVYDELCGQTIAGAEETLTAERATEPYTELLNIEPGSPVIVIDRLARGYDGSSIEWRRSWGAAEGFKYSTKIY